MNPSLYVHYPFCVQKCLYCAFNSQAGSLVSSEDYVAGLVREMELRRKQLGGDIEAQTLYFGGGTPSLMDPPQIGRLVSAARNLFNLRDEAETTLECNPGTIDGNRLAGFRGAGVNRLSIGMQSFDDVMLCRLGRIHTAAEGLAAFKEARAAGFGNVSIDLIHSLPGQKPHDWARELERVVALEPEHLSVYALTVEEGTPLAALVRQGGLSLPSEDDGVFMFELSSQILCDHGYEQYEIANFARPGCYSLHNRGYWERRPYLGFGAGAHSFLREPMFGARFVNEDEPQSYLRLLERGVVPWGDPMILGRRDAMAERLFLGLRMSQGVELDDFRGEFDVSFDEVFGSRCGDLFAAGFLEVHQGFLRLAPKARVLSNQVFLRFL
jgi:oxygen-independent coproporphyrinogen III oxidase